MFGMKRRAQERQRLVDALRWYANDANWQRLGVNPKGARRQWVKSPAAHDRGERARTALEFAGVIDPAPRAHYLQLQRPTVPAPLAINPAKRAPSFIEQMEREHIVSGPAFNGNRTVYNTPASPAKEYP